MTSLAVAARARRTHWHHPEWCAFALAGAAWLVLLVVAVGEPSHLLRVDGTHTPVVALGHACVMATAMMAPLAVPMVHHVAVFSLWHRRYRAAMAFLFGYLGVWTVVTAVLMVAAGHLVHRVGATAATAATFGAAIGALLLPGRRQLVRQCTAFRPLALRGIASDCDCVRFGAERGAWCVATCWPLMLAATVNHGLLVMAAASALIVVERRRGRRGERLVLLGTLAIGLGALLLTLPQPNRSGDTDPRDHHQLHGLGGQHLTCGPDPGWWTRGYAA